ncbi:hypothetical protein BN871_EV_00090 [Paenibacillus sp. P22]|nr:hypothetical protein BN871_EV_00090 [Paenibacillus sp. P22]
MPAMQPDPGRPAQEMRSRGGKGRGCLKPSALGSDILPSTMLDALALGECYNSWDYAPLLSEKSKF